MHIPESDCQTRWHNLPQHLRDSWDEFLCRVELPPLVFETLAIDADSEKAEPKYLAHKIGSDPLLAAKVLSVANAASMGQTHTVVALDRAVIQLGLNLIQGIVATYYLEGALRHRGDFSRRHFEFVRRWGAMSSSLAGRFAREAKLADAPVIAMAALLSRLGGAIFTMLQPGPGQEYWTAPNEVQRLRYETAHWGLGCCALSARQIEIWGLPEPLPGLATASTDMLVSDEEPARMGLPQQQGLACMAAGVALAGAYLNRPETRGADVIAREAYSILSSNLRRLKLYDAVLNVYLQTTTQRELQLLAK